MRIRDIIDSARLSVSCEVFPPKRDGSLEAIRATIGELAGLAPDFISVTYGAGGSTSKNTLDVASLTEKEHGIPCLAHLTCCDSTKEQVRSRLDEMESAGIKNVLALRGDIPDGSCLPRDYSFASELVRDIKSHGNFCTGGACYPEGHFQCADIETDIENLLRKVNAGCEFLITQLFFDNGYFYSFMDKAAQKGIDVPVIAGIMPVLSVASIRRISEFSRVSVPAPLAAVMSKYGNDPDSLKSAGVEYAVMQAAELASRGVRGIHVYTMNKPEIAREILTAVRN